MTKPVDIGWLAAPRDRDYPAALSYLQLLFEPSTAENYVTRLRQSTVVEFKAKDIFRASGLSLLGVSNGHVEKDRDKIQTGEKLSPLLLVRSIDHGRVIIADGYHRLCATYGFDEDAVIPCKIV